MSVVRARNLRSPDCLHTAGPWLVPVCERTKFLQAEIGDLVAGFTNRGTFEATRCVGCRSSVRRPITNALGIRSKPGECATPIAGVCGRKEGSTARMPRSAKGSAATSEACETRPTVSSVPRRMRRLVCRYRNSKPKWPSSSAATRRKDARSSCKRPPKIVPRRIGNAPSFRHARAPRPTHCSKSTPSTTPSCRPPSGSVSERRVCPARGPVATRYVI